MAQNIYTQIDLINRIRKIEDALKATPIIWETDIKKIDFSKLRTPISFGRTGETMRIDTINPLVAADPYWDANNKELFSGNDTPIMMDLAELVISGEKIIPPIYCLTYRVIDGERVFVDNTGLMDGSHRLRLSAYLKLTEIPIIVFDRVFEYSFSPEKWNFNQMADKISISSLFGGTVYEFSLGNGCYIDEMKTDYLTICETGQVENIINN